MIVRDRPTFLDVLTAMKGSVLPQIARPLLFMLVVSVSAVGLTAQHAALLAGLSAMPFTLMGLSLSIFMGFRNTACYDRWWEARKLWGQLIIASRSFARQITGLPRQERIDLLSGIAGFAGSLAASLRGSDGTNVTAMSPVSGTCAEAPNPTDAILARVGRRCGELVDDGLLDPIRYSVLEIQLTELAHVQGGCERIRNTPLPFAYALLLHRTAYAFCLLLPFALAPTLRWWTPLPVLLVSYAFFGLDALSDELGDPFGVDQNDLPLDSIVRTVEREMLSAAGETDLPPMLEPTDFVLM